MSPSPPSISVFKEFIVPHDHNYLSQGVYVVTRVCLFIGRFGGLAAGLHLKAAELIYQKTWTEDGSQLRIDPINF